ncbi:MAG: 4Fe-4S dicluster domain-containing protein, partial [Rikenellaceae bacterium]|nr:4Fe-4S dicluster domain-containing protein [Rikenellaceae bacterium]
LHDIARLVVEKYDGSLKGEHGTGRNIAPYVAYEWGEELWQVMKDLKALFDPNHVLNRGVIFNDDPKCNMKHLKSMSLTNKNVDRCIECGFCEVNCLTCGFTLSARQRIASQREISRLRASGESPELLKAYLKEYRYYGEQTCAGDGLCSTSCPVQINTGHLTHDLREAAATPTTNKVAQWTADNFSTITSAMRVGLKGVNGLRVVFGSQLFGAMARGVRTLSGGAIPLWTRSMPRGSNGPKQGEVNEANPRKVVYFPSCINQVMGTSAMDSTKEPLHRVMERVMRRAGFEVIYPERMEHLCCGTIWESKGFPKQADEKSAELEAALRKASNNGEYPIVCDQSPCLYRMKNVMKSLKLYEPAEFIVEHCAEHLTFKPVNEQIALHYTCSMRKMGKTDYLLRLAQMCTSEAMVPEEVGCCGFAGDRGFTFPEVNAYALRKLRPQVEAKGIKAGYSNSRTCEIGLATNSGIPYSSIVYLVDRCTE